MPMKSRETRLKEYEESWDKNEEGLSKVCFRFIKFVNLWCMGKGKSTTSDEFDNILGASQKKESNQYLFVMFPMIDKDEWEELLEDYNAKYKEEIKKEVFE